MAWKGKTKYVGGGRLTRRCGDDRHEGVRWLPLTHANFHETRYGFLHRCKTCQRRYARDRWRALHPTAKVRAPRLAAMRRAGHALDVATARWGH